jgi:hypothetical protein
MKRFILTLCTLLFLLTPAYADDYRDYIVRGQRNDSNDTPYVIYRYPINSDPAQMDTQVQRQPTYLIPLDGKDFKPGDQFFELHPTNPEANSIIVIEE